ncbi:MAG: hypothetical protein IIA62_09770, partial [Nitrospinae bacterium]|nr:hypothetical protein [Nitrospinota bacterium]
SRAFESYVDDRMNIDPEELAPLVDQLMRHPEFTGQQRHNSLGIAFPGLICHLLARFGSSEITYRTEFSAIELFPTLPLPGSSAAPKIDIAAFKSKSKNSPFHGRKVRGKVYQTLVKGKPVYTNPSF